MLRKPQVIKKYEKSIGKIEDWVDKPKEKQKALIKYAQHLDSRGQLDEILRG